jgi:hypothetical protein
MKLFKRIFLVVSLFFALSMTAMAFNNLDVYEYWVQSGTSRSFEWSAVPGASGYELYIWQLENSQRFLSGKIVTASTHTILWKTHGHYIVYIRHFKLVNGVRNFGEWGNSLDPAIGVVDGKPKAWIIYVF